MSRPTLNSTEKGHVTNLIYCSALNGFATADTKGYVTTFDSTCQNQQSQALIQKDEDIAPSPITSLSHFAKDRCSAAMGTHAYSLSLRANKNPTIKTEVFEFDVSCDICIASPQQKWIAAIGDFNRVVILDPNGDVDQIDIKLTTLQQPHKATYASFDSSSSYLAIHTSDNSIHIIDIKTSRVSQTFSNLLTSPQTIAPTADHNESTFFSPSSFTHPFPASPSLLAVPTGATISLFTTKNWSKAPSVIFSPSPQNNFISVAFSHNNALLASITSNNEVFIFNMIDTTYPLLFRFHITLSITTSQLTTLCWGPISTSSESKPAELVLAGRDGVIIAFNKIADFIDSSPTNQPFESWPISHLSTQAEIAKYNAATAHSTPSKSPAKYNVEGSDDDEDEIIIRTTTPKTLKSNTNTQKKRKQASGDNTMNDDVVFQLDDDMDEKSVENDKNAPTNQKSSKNPTKKVKIADYNADSSDSDHNEIDGSDIEVDLDEETPQEKLRKTILSTTILKDTTIDLDGITALVREELHEHFLDQFRKNYITAQHTALQAPFMPTSTQAHIPNPITGDEVKLLHASEYGSIVSRIHDGNATFGITLHATKRVEKLSLQFNETHYSLATMDQFGIVLGLPAWNNENKRGKTSKKLSLPSHVLYQTFDEERNMNFSFELPFGESVECIALSKDILAVATNKQFLRIYDLSGMEIEIISLPGKILTMCAKGPYMAIFYHNNTVPLADSHSIQMQLYHTETMHILYDHIVALSPYSKLLWCYISSTGILYTCDSIGIVRLFSSARGNSWKVMADLKTKVEEKDYFLWPVYIDYVNESDANDKPWSHKIFSYECYKKKEPTPAVTMPNLKAIKLQIPFSRLLSTTAGDAEKKIQESLEPTVRERLLWDELVSTHGQTIPAQLNRTFDTPWVVLGIRLAQQGQTVRAIYIAKQIRDVEMLKKYIEKINTMTHLQDLDNAIKELTKILHLKQSFKKLGLFPYQQPLPHAAMYKSKEISTMAAQPHHVTINPFSSPQIQRTAAPTRDFQSLIHEPFPSTMNMDNKTTSTPNPFRKSIDLSGQSNENNPNPFRK